MIRSKPDGCSFNPTGDDNTNPGGSCTTPSSIDVSAPTFGGTPSQGFTVLVCNAKRAAATDQGGDNDPTGGCDSANARGLSSVPGQPASSGTFLLNGSGNMIGGTGNVPASGKINVLMTSCNGATGSAVPDLLKALGAPPCTNGNATTTCPPTQGQISLGWTCIVSVAEFDPVALTPGTHVGFRDIELKSPIPSKLCDPGRPCQLRGLRGDDPGGYVGEAHRRAVPVQGHPARRSRGRRPPGLVPHGPHQQDDPDEAVVDGSAGRRRHHAHVADGRSER